MNSNYSVLRVISLLYKVAAILVIILAVGFVVFSVIAALVSRDASAPVAGTGMLPWNGVLTSLAALVPAAIISLGLYASGELLELLIELVMNTRNSRRVSRTMIRLAYQQTVLLRKVGMALTRRRS